MGHHKTGIGAVSVVLRFDDDPAGALPAAGTLLDRCKQVLFLAGGLVPLFGQRHQFG